MREGIALDKYKLIDLVGFIGFRSWLMKASVLMSKQD